MEASAPSGAKRFCSSISVTKPRRLKLIRDQCVPSGVVQSDTCPCRDAPFEDVSAHTFASAGGLASCSGGTCAAAGAASNRTVRHSILRIIGFPLDRSPPVWAAHDMDIIPAACKQSH